MNIVLRRAMIGWVMLQLLTGCSGPMFDTVELRSTGYAVPRYENYPTITLRNVTNPSEYDLQGYGITAECEEHTFESLDHRFAGTINLEAGETADIRLRYSSGYPYFTDLRVWCEFEIEFKFGEPQLSLDFE